jgi:hypothetical protein
LPSGNIGHPIHLTGDAADREVHAIGDCVAARQAPAAIYEGRKLGLAL